MLRGRWGCERVAGGVDERCLLVIATLLRGVTYTKGDASDSPFSGSVPVLRANNIQGEKFDFSDLVHVPRDLVADSQLIRAGDVVVATSSGSISVVGKAAQARSKIEAGFGAFCGLLRPSSEVEPRYFGHYFSSAGYRSTVSEMARGVNINNLKREHFESLQIPLAPLPEQKRIADKLDTLLARVDACREHLNHVPAILKRFRQSVLAAATSGELTREWRIKNPEPESIEGSSREFRHQGKRHWPRRGRQSAARQVRTLGWHVHSENPRWLGLGPSLSDCQSRQRATHRAEQSLPTGTAEYLGSE